MADLLSNTSPDYPFLSGGGHMGELIRAIDWANNPLGSPGSWPDALKQTVSMMLKNSFPVLICWGPDYIQFYNDAFRPINGENKHPQALGGSAKATYAEIWEVIGPMFSEVMSGKTHGFPAFKVVLDRNGQPEDCYFDFSYSPIADLDGKIMGVLVICVETTANVLLSKANNDLSRSEARFKYLIQEAPVAISVLHGRDLVIDSANEMMLKIWGKSMAIIGQPLATALPELEGQPFLQILDDVFTSGKPFYGDEVAARLEHAGTLKEMFFHFVYQPITDGGTETTDILVVAVDVTAQVDARTEVQQINEEMAAANEELATTNEELTEVQHRYEEVNRDLETSASRLRMAIESTNLGTWDYNPQTGELYWSKECRDIYGIPDGENPSMEAFSAHIYPEDRPSVEVAIRQAMDPAGKGQYDLSYRVTRFDNSESRWIKAQGTVYFKDGQAVRFIGTVVDIHELKLAEEKSAKLAAIIETSDDAIISKTLESVITSWNKSAQRVFGYTAEEMIGETIYKLIPPDRHDEEPQILATLKNGERVDHFETKRITKEGRLIDVSVTISPVKDKAGRIIGVSKIARDITEKKLDETRKSDFIGMASHELKTPLTSLNALLQVASAKLKNHEDSFLASVMDKSNIQVKRMLAMINGFLNVSRLESGKIHIEKQNFDMEALIMDTISEASLTVSTHLIHFAQCAPLSVHADRDKIGAVISNLISNAIKYSPKGKNIEVTCVAKAGQVVVSVKDQGMGIAPDDLARIFDRYYRVEANHTRHISGFGIGLYLSSEIISRHGGKVWAESQSGVGSTFYFSLPL
jgi:PAS domain S-box-containing protein